MKKKVSLKDIAKKVGVSTATVSYVLSKGKESGVSAEVSEKVKKAAKELKYQPNQIAKSLKMGKTFTIGLIVADISNPFFAHIARIIEDEATRLNYTVIFGSSDEKSDKSWDLIQFLTNRQVDGFIIAPTENSEKQIKYLKEQHIPFVLIDRYFPEISSNYVVIDNFKAAYKAVNRLIETGNQQIGIVAYSNSLYHMRERVRGYKSAMGDNTLEVKNEWLHEIDFSDIKLGVKKAIDELLLEKKPVEAIFFATNTLAVHGLKYIDELNLKVGEDLAIVSFDEGEAFDFYYCPLSYIKQPLSELAENAVAILTKQISDHEAKEEQVCLEAELVIRESCQRSNS
ncbi:LacI family DNA-binding transcriptional regulator [Autumnicola musiva]|uniref:Substrate-binding domain-containing protein n=1 Tax=Autumnicola musiva TaxID=3075589 RepID=A0ABU3DAF4_9FLAO|nr:substrate-binding domain-containing protein [Zunongwangia sp. F117]MDT0678510.1 substrate-binding domain-containing protein [Zunongwangia sp. F117]